MLMFCMNCGKKIDDNSKFCQFCGSPIKDNVSQSMPQQQPQIPVRKKVNPILVGSIGLGCLAVVLCGVHFLSSDKQDSPAEVAVTESAPVEDSTDNSVVDSVDNTEVEETDTGNNVYYLTEEDIFSQLDSFFNFCWSNSAFNSNRDLGQDTIDLGENSFRSLYAVTVEKSIDVGVVAIYETNPNMILTSDFADVCLSGGNSDIDNLINNVCMWENSIKFIDSNIDGTWHFYEGTDECVYAAVSVDDCNFTIEMVQCTEDPYKWLINNIDMRLNQDLLDAKLKNEDDISLESDSVAGDSVSKEQDDEFLSAYTDYIEEVLAEEEILGYNLIYIDDNDIPECLVWTKAGADNNPECRVFVLSYKNDNIESVTTDTTGWYADVLYSSRSGDFSLETSIYRWYKQTVFTLDDSFHKVISMEYESLGTSGRSVIDEQEVSSEEYDKIISQYDYLDSYTRLSCGVQDTSGENFYTTGVYSSLLDAYDALRTTTYAAYSVEITKFDLTDNILTVEADSDPNGRREGFAISYPVSEDCTWEYGYYNNDGSFVSDEYESFEYMKEEIAENQQNIEVQSQILLCVEVVDDTVVRVYRVIP